MYKVLDIFSGAGGMAEGFLNAGFSIPYASDISKQAMMTYVNRHEELGYDIKFINDDLNNVVESESIMAELLNQKFDVIIGGPPCQGFSNAGKRSQTDERNKLVLSYLKMINIIRPKYFVMENVVGIKSFVYDRIIGLSDNLYENVNAVDVIINEFQMLGYSVKCITLDASDYSVPQNRKRVFFLGSKNLMKAIQIPEKHAKKVTVEEAISDLSTGKIMSEYQRNSINGRTKNINGKAIKARYIVNNEKSNHNKLTVERFSLFSEGESLKEVLNKLPTKKREKYYTKKNSCRRLKRDAQSPTVVTLPDDYIHYSEDRIMTVREMARLQSFDDSFKFLGKRTTGGKLRKLETPQYTQVGNAVPPLLSYAVALKVMECLNDKQ